MFSLFQDKHGDDAIYDGHETNICFCQNNEDTVYVNSLIMMSHNRHCDKYMYTPVCIYTYYFSLLPYQPLGGRMHRREQPLLCTVPVTQILSLSSASTTLTAE